MLGGCIGRRERPWRVRRDRAVVDDPAAARALVLHDAEGVLGAQERRGQIGRHHRLPLRKAEILEIHRRRAHAGIVEQHIEPAIGRLHLDEQGFDRGGIGHVGGNRQAFAAEGCAEALGLLQLVETPADQHDGEPGLHQRQRCGAADAGAGAGDDSDLLCSLGHGFLPLLLLVSGCDRRLIELSFPPCRAAVEYCGARRAAPPTSASADRGNRVRRLRCDG